MFSLAGLALKLSPVGSVLKKVGAFLGRAVALPLWLIGLIAIAILIWHTKAVNRADQAGYDRAVVVGEKLAEKTNKKVITVTVPIRKKADENATRIVASADNERLLGPGKAALRCPQVPASTGGSEPRAGTPNDARDSVPTADGIDQSSVVPWGWLVSHAQTCDLNLNEVKAWREWHKKVLEIWPAE